MPQWRGKRSSVSGTPFVRWLVNPRPDRGIHFLADTDSWEYVSYVDLARRVNWHVVWLGDLGVSAGDRVAVITGDPLEFLQVFHALQLLGVTVIPLPLQARLQPFEAARAHLLPIVANARPKLVLVGHATSGFVRNPVDETIPWRVIHSVPDQASLYSLPARSRAASLPVIQYTSGATSSPRGVKVPRESLVANFDQIGQWLAISPDDRRLSGFHTTMIWGS